MAVRTLAQSTSVRDLVAVGAADGRTYALPNAPYLTVDALACFDDDEWVKDVC